MARTLLTRVQRAGAKTQVFEQLRDRIMERTWAPGAKIPSENALAEALGLSRVAIREALQMLASLGLLETRRGGGTCVREYAGEERAFRAMEAPRTDAHAFAQAAARERGGRRRVSGERVRPRAAGD